MRNAPFWGLARWLSEVTELKSERSICHARLMIFKPENKIQSSRVVFFGLWFCLLFLLSVWLSSFLSPQIDQLLGSVIEMWVDRMDNITQPERRKLSSLALLSLLPSDNRCDMSLFFGHADGAVGQARILSNLAPRFLTLNLLCDSPLIKQLHFQYKPKKL